MGNEGFEHPCVLHVENGVGMIQLRAVAISANSGLNGAHFIMYARVGVWEDIVREKMPNSIFYKQEDIDAVGALAAASELPGFTTDITQRIMPSRRNNRVNIPFSDPEAYMQFYLVCRDADTKRFWQLFAQI